MPWGDISLGLGWTTKRVTTAAPPGLAALRHRKEFRAKEHMENK